MQGNELTLRAELEQMSSERLRTLLHTETEKAVPDDDLVLTILHILEDREPDELVPASDREKAAWKLYRKRVKARRKRPVFSGKSLANAAVLVLVVGLLFAAIPQEAEADSLWDVLMRWTSNAIEWFSPTENKENIQFPFQTDNPGLQQIYNATLELGIEDPLIPMWFPDGYVLDYIKHIDTPREKHIFAHLIKDNEEAVFIIRVSETEVAHGYFAEEDAHISFEREGVEYVLTQNMEKKVALWHKDNREYFITLDCQDDALQRILDSIYVMEDNE